MPVVIYFKNGTQLVIKGERIEKKEWKHGHRLQKKAINGHNILILTDEINIVEYVPDEEYQQRIEEMKRQKEAQAGAQASRIARPAMMIPRKKN